MTLLESVQAFIWGPPTLVLLMGTGLYFTYKLRGIQLFKFPKALKSIFEKEDRKDIFFNLSEAIGRYEGMKNGSAKYQYGDIYLTNGLDRAKSYAYRSFAFGEVGLNAYRMLEAAKFLGLTFDPRSRAASLSNQLWTFAHDNPQPIVLTFHHVSSDDLLLDNGKELKGLDELLKDCTMSFRAKKNDNFNLNMAEIQYLPSR